MLGFHLLNMIIIEILSLEIDSPLFLCVFLNQHHKTKKLNVIK